MQFCIFILAVTKTIRRNYGGHTRPARLNDMPIPEGDFFAHHAKRQREHNTVLALGICSLGFGLTLVSGSEAYCTLHSLMRSHFSVQRH